MIISGLMSAITIFIAKKIGKELPTLVYTAWQMIIGSILLFIIGHLMGGRVNKLTFTPSSVILLLYLALLSSVAFCLWYYILQFRKVGELAMYKFVVPVSGTLLTALFIPSEKILPIHIAALLSLISANKIRVYNFFKILYYH